MRWSSDQPIDDGMRNIDCASPSTGRSTGPLLPITVGMGPFEARTGGAANSVRSRTASADAREP